jgi:hypothetical protein
MGKTGVLVFFDSKMGDFDCKNGVFERKIGFFFGTK